MAKKNQKYRKQKQSKNFPWLFVALGGGLLLIVAIVFASQNSASGMPFIAVDQQTIDYGDVKFGVEKTFAIKVTNKGEGALRFKEDPYIEVVEGC